MVEKKPTLKGARTYLSIIAIVLTVIASSLGKIEILTPDITNAIVVLLGAFAVYFRKQA